MWSLSRSQPSPGFDRTSTSANAAVNSPITVPPC